MEFANFDLLISDPASVRVVASPGGETTEPAQFAVDPDAVLGRYEALAARPAGIEDRLKEIGLALFQATFSGQVLDLFRESVGAARGDGRGLRVRLRVESPSLSRLPWEIIFSRRDDFFSTNSNFSLCRYLPVPRPAACLQVELPLRLHMAAASPQGLPQLDIEAERSAMTTALETLEELGGVEISFQAHTSRASLLDVLQHGPIHILHFIGHGGWDQDHGLIFLEAAGGVADPTDAAALGELAAACPSLRLIVLNACSTAREDAQAAFSGAASRLVARGVPAVAAMRNPIEDRVAISFARHFYGNLAGGDPVDVALTRTRQQLRLERSADPAAFAIPILHLHTPDGLLFDVAHSARQGLVRVGQQIVQLGETSRALAEWKELHDILQVLSQPVNLAAALARDPAGVALVPGIWDQVRQSLESRLLSFARDRMRFIGPRLRETDAGLTGEEWAVRAVELERSVRLALGEGDADAPRELIGQFQTLIVKHLSLSNRKMVSLLEDVTRVFERTRAILEELRAQRSAQGAGPLNWSAIDEDVSALEAYRGRTLEWMRLHDLFDRLHVQFATIAANASTAGPLDLIAMPWALLRDTLILQLLEEARQISRIGRAYLELGDGSLEGEPWALEIKRKSDQLDAELAAHDPDRARQTVRELEQLIERHYLQVNRQIKDEMLGISRLSISLHARVTI